MQQKQNDAHNASQTPELEERRKTKQMKPLFSPEGGEEAEPRSDITSSSSSSEASVVSVESVALEAVVSGRATVSTICSIDLLSAGNVKSACCSFVSGTEGSLLKFRETIGGGMGCEDEEEEAAAAEEAEEEEEAGAAGASDLLSHF